MSQSTILSTEVKVVIGIGEEYPGEASQTLTFTDASLCFSESVHAAYQAGQEVVDRCSEDVFVWISVFNHQGENLFEVEDALTEWLDE